MRRHCTVDLTGQFNEACLKIVLASFPSEVKGVDRNAMSAETWARIKGCEAERFRRSSFHHFPGIDLHTLKEQFQLVDHSNIHAAIDVLQQLCSFCHTGRRYGDDALDNLAVKGRGYLQALCSEATYELRNCACGKIL